MDASRIGPQNLWPRTGSDHCTHLDWAYGWVGRGRGRRGRGRGIRDRVRSWASSRTCRAGVATDVIAAHAPETRGVLCAGRAVEVDDWPRDAQMLREVGGAQPHSGRALAERIERIDQGSESPSKTLRAAVIPLEEHIKPVDDVPVAISFGEVPSTSHKN